jgi:hypothetical protein
MKQGALDRDYTAPSRDRQYLESLKSAMVRIAATIANHIFPISIS